MSPKWHCIFGQKYSTPILALAYANPLGSAVLLCNLYTAVWEGHAFCRGGILIMYFVHVSFQNDTAYFWAIMHCCLGRSCFFLHVFVSYSRGCDLVLLLIREGIVGGLWGREKIFCFRNTNLKILNVHGSHLVCWGHFTLQIKGG